MNLKFLKTTLFCLFLFMFVFCGFFVLAQGQDSLVTTFSEAKNNKIAPGDPLPISVKLINFGSQKRVDVIVTYKVLETDGKEIYSESETVAVDTTASFIKKIQLPIDAKPGIYSVLTSIKYPYQEAPAESEFQIKVENKIGEFFVSDLILYSAVFLIIIIAVIFLTGFLSSKKQKFNINYLDYSDKPKEEVIYYEILSDIISEMRLRLGDDALKIAMDIPNLEINEKTGLVISIKEEPAKIIALLISRYQKVLGHKVSFSLRK